MDQEFINQLAEKLSKLGTKRPLGFHYAHPFGTVPPDSIICNGAEYNRALYADFFAYATEQGWVKTETEWQEIASQNNGYCSYYSDGDGSTTFRTPKFAPFMQIAIASGNVGKYHQAGLPDITGSVSVSGGKADLSRTTGTLVSSGALTASSLGTSSSEWKICVVVFGVATNVGSADVGNVMSAVAQVQAELPNKLSNTTPHIVDTWKSGESWYRKWSDGFIEQGGTMTATEALTTKTFHVAFSKIPTVILTRCSTRASSSLDCELYPRSISTSNFSYAMFTGDVTNPKWYACGY